jgi:hypothetical protein
VPEKTTHCFGVAHPDSDETHRFLLFRDTRENGVVRGLVRVAVVPSLEDASCHVDRFVEGAVTPERWVCDYHLEHKELTLIAQPGPW